MNNILKKIILAPFNLLYSVCPEKELKLMFRIKQGYKLNIDNPVTYNEKLQYVKLRYNNPLLPKLVDKYTVRNYVAERCPEILVKLLWQGFDPEEIPWDELPQRFVIKVTHGSGFNIICKDKNDLDIEKCIKKLKKWLKTKFLKCYGEWFYGVEKPRIIIEEFLDDGSGEAPTDFKVMCFNGRARYFAIDTDRYFSHKKNIYDIDWNYISGVSLGFPNDEVLMKQNKDITEKLIKYAEILSNGFPHVRVDLYVVKGKVFFGEMTFTNGAGFDKFTPYAFDVEMGRLFDIGDIG